MDEELSFIFEEARRLHRRRPTMLDDHVQLVIDEVGEQYRDAVTKLMASCSVAFELPTRSAFESNPHSHKQFLLRKLDFYRERKANLEHMRKFCIKVCRYIPLPSESETTFGSVPLFTLLPNLAEIVDGLFKEIRCDTCVRNHFFDATRERMEQNQLYSSYKTDKQRIEAPASSFLFDQLRETVFFDLLNTPVPVPVTNEDRFNHMHILGGTGAGKTSLLETMILNDLKSDASLVIVDSQGDLIRKVLGLEQLHKRRVILISPKDVHFPPALNIFDVNRERLGAYDQATREQVIAGVIQTFDYLFSGLVGADLSAKQGVFFKYVARLMLSLPETMGRNATIIDMLRIMEDVTPYLPAIRALPQMQREFFERDFGSKTFTQTKEQIRYRLHAIIENPTLARLFTSPTTKVDLFAELNNGSIILVDTAKDFLKGSSAHFGQIFISLVLQAVLERAALPNRHPSFLYVDEAAEYFDSNIDDLLTETRKFKLGCVFAHQYLDQCSSGLKASLAANTGIKFAGGVSMSDARSMAPDMRTTPDFILGQPRLHFAAHIRNRTPHAISVPVILGVLDAQPKLPRDLHAAFIASNRQRVAYTPEVPLSPAEEAEMSDEY